MATFKVGQRVRIVESRSRYHLREATIVAVLTNGQRHTFDDSLEDFPLGYRLCVDGIGTHTDRRRLPITYLPRELSPLTDPGEEVWAAEAVRKVTKPEPVAPKVPEKVTT